jgi:hypothetical protein
MINTKHLLKVVAAWVTIVYVVCFVGVALIPGVRPWFMQYALHMNVSMGEILSLLPGRTSLRSPHSFQVLLSGM